MSVDNPLDKRRKAGSGAPAGRGSRGAARGIDAAEVHERIWSAIMDHSLPPETRLVEGELCKIFGLGRTRLRQVLQRLARGDLLLEERTDEGVDLRTVLGARP
jgi:DNA-binding GntR family transcriptional regulator